MSDYYEAKARAYRSLVERKLAKAKTPTKRNKTVRWFNRKMAQIVAEKFKASVE